MHEIDYQILIKKAKEASIHARAQYSNFKVGSALLTSQGKIHLGCNIESSSFGLTICAERVALLKALSEGEKDFEAIVIYAQQQPFCPPCGACRQFLMDYTDNLDIILTDGKDYKIHKLNDLLPVAFTKSYFQKNND